jgi:hypothetical protein
LDVPHVDFRFFVVSDYQFAANAKIVTRNDALSFQVLDRQRMEQARQAAEQAVEDLRTYRWVLMLSST